MAHQRLNQNRPIAVIRRRRDVGLPPKAADLRIHRQVLRKKAEFHKRPDASGRHGIEKIVNILPVENQPAVFTAAHEHVVMEDAMEAQIAESAMADREPEVFAPSRPQPFIGPARADAEVPKMVQRTWFRSGAERNVLSHEIPPAPAVTARGQIRYPPVPCSARNPALPSGGSARAGRKPVRRDRRE